jgi:hypothetical protein
MLPTSLTVNSRSHEMYYSLVIRSNKGRSLIIWGRSCSPRTETERYWTEKCCSCADRAEILRSHAVAGHMCTKALPHYDTLDRLAVIDALMG